MGRKWSSCQLSLSYAGQFCSQAPACYCAAQASQHRPEVSFAKRASLSLLQLQQCTPVPAACCRAAPADKGRSDDRWRGGGRPSGRSSPTSIYFLVLDCALSWLLPLLAAGQIDRSPSGFRVYLRDDGGRASSATGDERGRGMEEVAVAAAAGMERAAACKRPRGALDGGDRSSAAAAWRSCRVARAAAGGKDRHSKVVTARGLRDRRVRLSVPTAIQFYDIQDRLGVDQPSKAIEWLIRAAAAAIDGLPSLDCSFALPAAAAASPPGAGDDAEVSTSDTSKSSVLSLANAPADNAAAAAQQASHAYNGNASAFAEFLQCSANDTGKPVQQQPTLAYYAAQPPSAHAAPPLSFETMQPHLSFLQEQPHHAVAFDRGTLQSNAAVAAPLWPTSQQACLLQRFAASPADATGLPFFLGGSGAAASPVPANAEPRLQLWDFKQERGT